MSAYSIGSTVATIANQNREKSTTDSSVPAAFIKWIPSEAVTFYAAVIGIGAAQGELTGKETPEELLNRIDSGSFPWFLLGLAVALLLVVAGAFKEKQGPLSPLGLTIRVLLTAVGFVIWTSALPGSWPFNWHWVRDMGPAYMAFLAVVAGIYTTLAEASVRHWKL